MTVGIGLGSGTAQVLVKQIGVRANTIVGMVIAAVGLFYLSRVPVDGTYVVDLLPGLLLMSFGMGNTFVPITLIATTNVDEHDAGLASGPLQHVTAGRRRARAWRSCSTLAADRTASYLGGLGHQPGPQEQAAGLVEGFQVAFTSAAILVTIGAILLALLLRSRDVANVNPEQGMVPMRRGLLVAVDDAAAVEVIRGDLDADLVAGQHADAEPAHLAGEVSEQLVVVLELDAEQQVRQGLGDLAVDFELLLDCHRHLPLRRTERARGAGRPRGTLPF